MIRAIGFEDSLQFLHELHGLRVPSSGGALRSSTETATEVGATPGLESHSADGPTHSQNTCRKQVPRVLAGGLA